jgi:hypothetical protein
MDDLSFPPPPPPLSQTNFALDLELDMDFSFYPYNNNISINESLPFPTPSEFLNVNVDSVANDLTLFRPNLNSSSIDDTNMFNNLPPGAATIEWYHSPSVSPNFTEHSSHV